MATMLKTAGAAGAGLLLAWALAACGGGGGGGTTEPETHAGTLQAAQPGELAAYVQNRLRVRQGQRAAGGVGGDAGAAAPVPSAGVVTPVVAGTVVQEAGVDEADLLKTDGTHLYTLQPEGSGGNRLRSWLRQGDGSLKAQASLLLPVAGAAWIDTRGLLPTEDLKALGVISQVWTPADNPPICIDLCPAMPAVFWATGRVEVQRVDVSDAAAPVPGTRLTLDGSLVDSRRVGNRLYLVTRHQPVLAADVMPFGTPEADREAMIGAVGAADVLPRVRVNGGEAKPLVAETDCWLQTDPGSPAIEITTLTVVDLDSPGLAFRSRCFVGGSEALYMSTSALYVATGNWSVPMFAPVSYPPKIQTFVHKFALEGDSVAYRGTGAVDGHLGWDPERKSFRFSEHEGLLRVLTYTADVGWWGPAGAPATTQPPSPARLTLLREDAASATLKTVSTLPNAKRPATLGKEGEQVYAVRFDGARGYLVTFRRIDPLYVLDLSDPADPKTTAALETAGFSSDLYPLGEGLLFGVGRDADESGRVTGLKFALFDVRDAAAPAVLGSHVLPGVGNQLALDGARHGIAIGSEGGRARISLPGLLSADYSIASSSLLRLEVDLAARTLAAPPPLGTRSGWPADLWLRRSVQIGAQVYYLRDGTLEAFDW